MRSKILMHVRANPLVGTARLLRSLTLARQWIGEGGQVLVVSDSLPRILMRQIAMAGCQLQILPNPQNDQKTAGELRLLAEQEGCRWIVTGDSRTELVRILAEQRAGQQKVLVMGRAASPDVDFQTAGDLSFALVRRNLPVRSPSRRAAKSTQRRCLLDLSQMGAADTEDLMGRICRRFQDGLVVFDVVTPFARAISDQLTRQHPSLQECFFWHRNSDRAFQTLFAFQLTVASDLATFCETAFARIPSLLLTQQPLDAALGRELTTLPWCMDRQRKCWMGKTVEILCRFLESPTRCKRHGKEMERLIDGQAAMRLCQVLRDPTAVTRLRSA